MQLLEVGAQNPPRVRSLVLIALLAVTSGPTGVLTASEPQNILAEFTIHTWNQSDGLPSAFVRALEQDSEGYLWIGTDAGLYRFDGLHFTLIHQPGSALTANAQIRALAASVDGRVWVGLGNGQVVRVARNLVQDLGKLGTPPGGTISVLVEDAQGALWAGGSQGLFKQSRGPSGGWNRIDGPLVANAVLDARFDRAGRLLVVTANGVLRGDAQNTTFAQLDTGAGEPREIVEAPGGTLYQTDSFAGFREVGRSVGVQSESTPLRGRHIIVDGEGAVWLGTGGQGLWRWRRDSGTGRLAAATITPSTGLPAGGVVALEVDHQGNIWVATPAGLSRLSHRKVGLIPNLLLVAGAEQTPDGSAWVGTADELMRFAADGQSDDPIHRWSIAGAQLRAMHADQHGTVWIATDRFLAQVVNGRIVRLPAGDPMPHRIDTLTSDSRGGVVAYDLDRGLLRWRTGRFESIPVPHGLVGQAVVASHTDRSGRIWLAYANGSILQIAADDTVELHEPARRAAGGRYVDIYEDDRGVLWFAGDLGLTRFADGVFATLRRERGFFGSSLTSLVADASGNLWIGSIMGLTLVERGEIEKALQEPSYDPRYVTYDRFDGLAGLPVAYSRNRNPLRRPNGTIWFLTGQGITVVNPATMGVQRPRPKVYVESLTANDTTFESAPGAPLSSRTSRVDFEYSALDVTFAGRIQFRYQLEGFDPGWVVAGTRRQASYANLPPRQYRFRVSASGGDGRWVDSETGWEFSIHPVFYRTSWFAALVLCGAGSATWVLWRGHLKRVRREFLLLLTERARVSREIHDTLLQNLVALTLEFDAAAFDTANPMAKGQLATWRQQLEQYILEARQSIWNLRAPAAKERPLPTVLREACERSASTLPAGFISCNVVGMPRPVTTNIEDQVIRIAQEAVINAVHHADAAHVNVSLIYTDLELKLVVEDDGVGFDTQAHSDQSHRHYGLPTMMERAESVGGQLAISSTRGNGARITARVPIPGS